MKSFFLIILFFFQICSAQKGFTIPSAEKKITIPFQLINNLIFIPVEINGVPLTFLLDTGVAETLLISLGDKEVNFANVEKMNFAGMGENMQIEGLKSQHNMVKVTDQLIDYHHTIFIILDEEFNFSSYVGIPVHGIMGYDFFQNHPVEIDYISKKITIYNQESYYKRKTKKFTEIKISVENKKPYAATEVAFKKEKRPAKMLIDIGNSDAVWIFPAEFTDFSTSAPSIDDFLGRGFNGDIHGKKSRISSLMMGEFKFRQPVTSLPDSASTQHLKILNGRKGSLGSEIMRRFTVVFDYAQNRMLLKKNKHFGDLFRSNMSGLEFKHAGSIYEQEYVKVTTPTTNEGTAGSTNIVFSDYLYKLVLVPVFAIADVRKNSAAEQSGLKRDDVLKSINGKSTAQFSLTELNEMMKNDEGKNFTFEIMRGGLPLKFNFTLTDPIPNFKE